MSVRIITDSASDMSPVEHPALAVLPLSVTFGTDVYMDGIDIDHQRFYEMLVERDELPKTGQVNPYAFSQAIAKVREAGDEAVIITVGAKLSGTNQSARTALAEAPGGDVYVVDSNNVTLGERVMVEYALRLVDEGRSAAQIAAAVEAVRDRVVVIGLLETLEYLVRGGRLSAAAGAVGTLLKIENIVAVFNIWKSVGQYIAWNIAVTVHKHNPVMSGLLRGENMPCEFKTVTRCYGDILPQGSVIPGLHSVH